MLKYFKENQLVHYETKQPANWQEAVRLSSQMLINKDLITSEYVDEIIRNVENNGPYIVIAEQIAMPHAAADSLGVKGTGISFTKFPDPVMFKDAETGETIPAILFFTLAAKDSESHLENIMNLMDLLMDEATVQSLLETQTMADFNVLLG